MSTGYSWEGIRQVRATLLGARHVPEHLCGGYVYLGRYISVRPLPSFFTFLSSLTLVLLNIRKGGHPTQYENTKIRKVKKWLLSY